MSKKKFQDGMDIGSELQWKEEENAVSVTTRVVVPKKSGKKFFDDLDIFFGEAMDDLWKSEELSSDTTAPSTADKTSQKEHKKSFLNGLDALFSSTTVSIPETKLSKEEQDAEMKRVTFLFDKEKLDALKNMAKQENKYLREIISKVLAEYLDQKVGNN